MIMLSAMRPHDPRYTELSRRYGRRCSLAYVMMGWPVLDPYARYHHAREHGRANLLKAHQRISATKPGCERPIRS